MLPHISNIEVLNNYRIKLEFNDGITKIVDFQPYIGNDPLTRSLADKEYFKKVKVYDRGRGIYWENGYDFCPDYLYGLETS